MENRQARRAPEAVGVPRVAGRLPESSARTKFNGRPAEPARSFFNNKKPAARSVGNQFSLTSCASCGRFSAAASALPSGSPRPVRVGRQRSGRGELKVVCNDFIQTVYFTTVTYTTALIPFKAVALILQVPACLPFIVPSAATYAMDESEELNLTYMSWS